ncbi:N-ethylmaleimide reductase [Methylobacterium sp. GXS13]|uniref:alkene reductase n=1 Tax=Methylobacterium sp. GXS13 TaxID=1730094 RepID=UPI00071BDBC4|nr:alkene reductase [Methylobacterium sp. GXS13]KST59879.1 N-ethylmaleimide reductase [Methylobacterium sp. GXS13]
MPISPILQPVTIGDLTLKNRVVMAPLTRSRSDNAGVPPDFAADYYGQRANAGLIISEATNISPQGVGYAYTPGIWSDAQVESWSRIVKTIHANDGLIFLQLWHTGRISHPELQPNGGLPVSASAIKPEGTAFTQDGMKPHVTPRALETDEIPGIVDDYRRAAENAKRAGFDGVEIHSANNYLLEQFVRDSTNTRTDRYGGSIENRLRFPLDVVRAVTEVWGGGARVGIRLSPATTQPGETPLDSDPHVTYGAYVDALNGFGLLYVHTIEGVTQQTRDVPDGVDFLDLRRRFKGAYIGNNQITLDLAEKELAEGRADLFSFGRPYIANPDLVQRLASEAPLAEAPKPYWYGGGSNGYSDWPGMSGPVAIRR